MWPQPSTATSCGCDPFTVSPLVSPVRRRPGHPGHLDEDGFHFLVFFDQHTPGDIGYRATASAFSREVLSASFEVPERDLPRFPFTPVDPLVVSRVNPRDPIS